MDDAHMREVQHAQARGPNAPAPVGFLHEEKVAFVKAAGALNRRARHQHHGAHHTFDIKRLINAHAGLGHAPPQTAIEQLACQGRRAAVRRLGRAVFAHQGDPGQPQRRIAAGGVEHGAHAARRQNDVGIQQQIVRRNDEGKQAVERGRKTKIGCVLQPLHAGKLLPQLGGGIVARGIVNHDDPGRHARQRGRHGGQRLAQLGGGVVIEKGEGQVGAHARAGVQAKDLRQPMMSPRRAQSKRRCR
ncbi:MAG: hypothetical protein NTV22_16200 [bacterium]|nr:hypothetical protein [bacterium]